MKRPTKFIRIIVVAVSICLLTVDPAAACRLLGGRRCCCVCSPCETACDALPCTTTVPAKGDSEPASKGESTSKPAPANEALPSPSDAPPGASTGGGTLTPSQQPPLNNDQSRTQPTRNASPAEPPAVRSSATLKFGEPHEPSPPALDRAGVEPQLIHEPSPLNAASAPREPAAIEAATTHPIATPAPGPAAAAPSASALAAPAPSLTELRPEATHAGPTASATPAPMDVHRSTTEPALPTIKPAAQDPLTTLTPHERPSSRSPATALPKPAKTAVDAPGFPPASDDPFAPLPKKPEPADDDPFAPLPQVKQSSPEGTQPLAAEPTNLKAKDTLTLGADGKLPLREWRDHSGQFRIKAKLVLILDGKVRLLKDTGRTTTVALDRLSEQDRAYVSEVISRYGRDLTTLDQLAAR